MLQQNTILREYDATKNLRCSPRKIKNLKKKWNIEFEGNQSFYALINSIPSHWE